MLRKAVLWLRRNRQPQQENQDNQQRHDHQRKIRQSDRSGVLVVSSVLPPRPVVCSDATTTLCCVFVSTLVSLLSLFLSSCCCIVTSTNKAETTVLGMMVGCYLYIVSDSSGLVPLTCPSRLHITSTPTALLHSWRCSRCFSGWSSRR